MSLLDRFSLDEEKRLRHKRDKLRRERRITSLRSEIEALENAREPITTHTQPEPAMRCDRCGFVSADGRKHWADCPNVVKRQ